MSSKLGTRKAESANHDHDFVRLVGNERIQGRNRPIELEEFGVQTRIGRDDTKSDHGSVTPISAVHVRSDVEVQGSQEVR